MVSAFRSSHRSFLYFPDRRSRSRQRPGASFRSLNKIARIYLSAGAGPGTALLRLLLSRSWSRSFRYFPPDHRSRSSRITAPSLPVRRMSAEPGQPYWKHPAVPGQLPMSNSPWALNPPFCAAMFIPAERHHRAGRSVFRRTLHRLRLCIYELRCRHSRVAKCRISLQLLDHLLVFLGGFHGAHSDLAHRDPVDIVPAVGEDLTERICKLHRMPRKCAVADSHPEIFANAGCRAVRSSLRSWESILSLV